jgi:hypothetical protein
MANQLASNPVTGFWTWRDVSRSITASGLRRPRTKSTWTELAEYLRRAIRRRDWWEGVRHEQTPAHEQALAAALVMQDFFRVCDGRLSDGSPRGGGVLVSPDLGPVQWPVDIEIQRLACVEPEDLREQALKPTVPLSLAEPTGYIGDPGHTNGGVSGAGAVHETTETKNQGAVFGVAAFSGVDRCGLPVLAWYFCASSFELGVTSNFDGMLQSLVTGAPASSGSGDPPDGPSDHAINAASMQREVRRALRQLTPAQRCVLEIAYEDRRHLTQDVTRFGHGAALIVARAGAAQRDFIQNAHGAAILGLQLFLMAVSGAAKRKVPIWDPLTKRAATELLANAHASFLRAMGQPPPRTRKRRVPPSVRELVVAPRNPSAARSLVVVEVVAA